MANHAEGKTHILILQVPNLDARHLEKSHRDPFQDYELDFVRKVKFGCLLK